MNKLIFTLALVGWSIGLFAQDDDRSQMEERMEAQKVAFITQELDLTVEESQVFWPLYNEHQKQAQKLRRKKLDRSELANISDADAEKLIVEEMSLARKRIELKEEYANKLMKVVPAKKVAILLTLDDRFKREMLKSIRKRMSKRGERRDRQ